MMFIKKIALRITFLILLLSIPINTLPDDYNEYNSHPTTKELFIVGTSLALVGYGLLWTSAHYYKSSVEKKYYPEFDLLLRAQYSDSNAIKEELISHILRQHHKEAQTWFGNPHGDYNAYPLLKYKNNLIWYINALQFFKYCVGSTKRRILKNLIEKLENILDLVVTDYRLHKEERDFAHFQLQKNRYTNV